MLYATLQDEVIVAGQTFEVENGIQSCAVKRNSLAWSIFPWTADTQGLQNYPGCANAAANNFASVIDSSNPAYYGSDVVASPEVAQQYVCQNFVPVSVPQEIIEAVAGARAPEAAP